MPALRNSIRLLPTKNSWGCNNAAAAADADGRPACRRLLLLHNIAGVEADKVVLEAILEEEYDEDAAETLRHGSEFEFPSYSPLASTKMIAGDVLALLRQPLLLGFQGGVSGFLNKHLEVGDVVLTKGAFSSPENPTLP